MFRYPAAPAAAHLSFILMTDSFDIVLATRNPGKVRELRDLLAPLPVRLLSADEAGGLPPVEEDQPTLEGNARKKALAAHRHTGRPALADDTGLEVMTLDGAPGVHSARFAGEEASDAANRARLLRVLVDKDDRRAQFRTVVAFAEGGEVHCVEGICRGQILREERGTEGFGYDSLFVPVGETRTFAELSPEEKNAISHRGRALQKFVDYLRERLSQRGGEGTE